MKPANTIIWMACAMGGVLLGSGLGVQLDYQPISFITDLGLSGIQLIKAGSLLCILGLMAHVLLRGSLIPR